VRRHHLAAVIAATVVAGLVPAGAFAQTVIIPDRGVVIDGARGTAEELELTAEEAARAFSASSGLTVGIVMPGPDQVPVDFDVAEIVEALTTTVERHGARVVQCDGPTVGPDVCIDRFVDDKAAGVVVIGSQGDLTVPTKRAADQAITYVISIGDSKVAPFTVVIDSDPITRAFEQGRAGGAPPGIPQPRGKRTAIVASAVPTGQVDPATDAQILGLLEAAPKAKVMAVLGPPLIETTADLATAVAALPASGILIGEGVRLTQATAEGLDALPTGLRVVAYSCTPSLMGVIDLGSRVRGCIARSNDGAGEAAGNAILDLLIGRDVPGFVDAPLYTYRGTVSIGPGQVQLGRRIPGENLAVSDEERAAAATALAGRTIGLVAPAAPGDTEPATAQQTREAIEAGVAALGATASGCYYGKNAKKAAACMAQLVESGVAAIIVVGDTVDLSGPASAAIAAGVPVIGSDAAYLGDTGAIYVDLDERAIARLQGRMAGVYATVAWPDFTGAYAAIMNSTGAAGRDPVAEAVERAASLANPNVVPVGRFKSSPKSAKAGLVAALKQMPTLRLLLGPNAARAAADIKTVKKPKPPKDLAAIALRCTEPMKDQVLAGGRIKGCVDVDLAEAGQLVVDALTRVFAGGSVPGLISVPIRPFPADAATPVGLEIPG
jgi:DNA-binding LacI/PurR family transcriptional regulator